MRDRSAELRAVRIHRRTDLTLNDLARWFNPIVAGWLNVYGRFHQSAMESLLQRVNAYVRRWAGTKYRKLRTYRPSGRGGRDCSTVSALSSPRGVGSEPVAEAGDG